MLQLCKMRDSSVSSLQLTRGVRQGDVLSLYLFAVCVDYVSNSCPTWTFGILYYKPVCISIYYHVPRRHYSALVICDSLTEFAMCLRNT